MKNFATIFFFFIGVFGNVFFLQGQSSIHFDSANYLELNLEEDMLSKFALGSMFSSNTGDSLGYRISRIVSNGIIDARLNSTNDSLRVIPQSNRFGQATITLIATNTATEEKLEQQITVVVAPVDDAPYINKENLFEDLISDQFSNDTTFYISLFDRAIDVDGDPITYSLYFENRVTTDNNFTNLNETEVYISGDSIGFDLVANAKYAIELDITATSNDTLSVTQSFSLIIDNAPEYLRESIELNEDFGSVKFGISQLIKDSDDSIFSLSLTFNDFLDDAEFGLNIIENDTNSLVNLKYLIDEDSILLSSKSNEYGQYSLPVLLKSGERNISENLVVNILNVDDRPIVSHGIDDQLLPAGSRLPIMLYELFEDNDNQIDYSSVYIIIQDASAFQVSDINDVILTGDTLFLTNSDSIIYITAAGVENDESVINVELSIEAQFPDADPIKDIFELTISRPITTYYVTKTGDDLNSGLSENEAFLTLQKAINNAQVRDTIIVYPGVYVENLSVNKGIIIKSSLYEPGMSEESTLSTKIKGNIGGGSVLNILRTEGFKLWGLTVEGSDGINSSENSIRSWKWQGSGGAAIDTMQWSEFDSYDPNARYFAVINLNNVTVDGTYSIDIRSEWDCGGELLFQVPLGSTGDFVTDGSNQLIYSTATKDVYRRSNGCNNFNEATFYLENNIPDGKLLVLESTNEFSQIYALNNGHYMIGLINRETINSYGAGIYGQNASFQIDKVIVQNHQNERSQWDNAAGVLVLNSRQVIINNSIIRNNTVQNGEASGIGFFWTDELKLYNTWVYENNSIGNNNCTSGGLFAQGLKNLHVENVVFINNKRQCGSEVRVSGTDNYSFNHCILSGGLNFQDVENRTGIVQNSIFLGGDISNWGPTKTTKLKIRNNLINAGIYLDYEIGKYGKNNIIGGDPGFVDADNLNFALQPGSTLIGAGVLTNSNTDLLGNVRANPEGSAPDIGVIENGLERPELIFTPYKYFDSNQNTDVHLRLETSVNWRNTYPIVEVVDLDNDGKDEVVYNEYLSDGSILKVLKTDGTQAVIHDAWEDYNLVKPLDINQDGFIDLVIATYSKIGYLYNTGDGLDPNSFVEFSGFGIHPGGSETIQWADLTSDGKLDAILSDGSGIRILDFNIAEPIQQNIQLNNFNNEWLGEFGDIHIVDINGDTRSDLVLERRWYNTETKDLLVFIQDQNSFEYRAEFSLIDVLEVPNNGDRSFDLNFASGDIDNDQLLDLFVSYEPNQSNQIGYFRRFEFENNHWNEQPVQLRLNDTTLVDFNEYFDVIINFDLVAFTEDERPEIFGFISRSHPENNDWERYYQPVFLELNQEQELIIQNGYFSQEIYRSNIGDGVSRPHFDFGFLTSDRSFDIALAGRKENGRNTLVTYANTFNYDQVLPNAPSSPLITVKGSKMTVNFNISTPYYNIRVCKDDECNDLITTSNEEIFDKSSVKYTGIGDKEITYFLSPGDYRISIQAINQHLEKSSYISSDTIEVTGLKFLSGDKIIDDFFNSVNLINIDSDAEPEAYGFKKRFWYNGGERPSTLKIFDLENSAEVKDFILDNTGETPLISDFDLNGQADILVNTGNCNWPSKPFATLMNIGENSEAPVFTESFTKLNIAFENGNCGNSITNSNLLVDIDQDGQDEVLTVVSNEWDQEGISIFAIEEKDFNQSVVLRPNGEDVDNWNGESFNGLGALIKSRMDPSGKGNYIGLTHTYLDPDNDGDADHLLAINMQKGNPISALYLIETLGAGRVRAHYLNHFIDKSIIHLETVKDDDQKTKIIIAFSDDTNYWSDAYSTRFVSFLNFEITNSPEIFESLLAHSNQSDIEKIQPVNYKQNENINYIYTEQVFEGIPLANKFEAGDINNDGLIDVVVVGSNSFDTWNASAILNIYLQNDDGGFDPYISEVSQGVKKFSFISSLNMIDINEDAQLDIVLSGRLRYSNDGSTVGFINQSNQSNLILLNTPSDLIGQNNGYKVELNWVDSNEGHISYAVQIGNQIDNYNISLGKLNQYGYPLFPDRFNTFHPSTSLTFDAYDLADRYYFRIKALDEYGNTSDFTAIQEVSLSQPFTLMTQTIPGLEEGGVAWGDYDRDGDLDLAIMGKEDGFTTAIYRNDAGTFVSANQNLQKQSKGDLEWVDYDNDGFLDLIVVGLNPQLLPSLNIYKNQNGTGFIRQNNAQIPGLTDATLAFGDADADGDMDMVMAGIGEENGQIKYSFKLYNNRYNEGYAGIYDLSPNFEYEGFVNGDIEFADLDNDGDLDIAYSGTGRGDQAVGGIIVNTRVGLADKNNSYVYQGSLSLKNSTISTGDIDLDGDLDLIASGVQSNFNGVEENVVRILYNNYYRIDSLRAYISFREEIKEDIIPLIGGDIDLTDFDNDGDLDILTSGADEFGNPQTLLYAQSSGNFFPVNAGFQNLAQSSVKWADFDTDGDMDVFISGKTGTISQTLLYENNTGNLINIPPGIPSNLKINDFGFGKIKLSWDKPTDDYTEKTSLSYVIALGDESGNSTRFTTESNLETGYRLNPKPSSTLQNFLYLELDPGTYYFSVQAVDANYAGSEFSEELSFDVSYIWKELNLGGIVDNSLPAGEDASVKFSDFDGDGDFDLAIFGKNPNYQWKLGLLENKGGSFEKIFDFENITKGDFDWADVNGDGTLDLFMTGENPYDETNVTAKLYLNRTPIINNADTTFDGLFRWSDGRIFDETFITWQSQEPNDDNSYFAYGYLNGSNPPQVYDIPGSDQWSWGTANVEVPVDFTIAGNGIWRWKNGVQIQNYIVWSEGNPWVDPNAESAYAFIEFNGLTSEPGNYNNTRPALLEISSSSTISDDILSQMYLIGSMNDIDYYTTYEYYTAQDIFDNAGVYYPGFTLLMVNSLEEWHWVEENTEFMYGWIGLKVRYPSIELENINVRYVGYYRSKNYFQFDYSNGPNQAYSLITNKFPKGSMLFVPNDQGEVDFMTTRLGNHGLIGIIRKGFPAGYQDYSADFQNSNLYFEPLVNAKVKFTDIDNNGTPELIYAGSTSSTSIGRPALKIYKFLEDGFNITQREVQLNQELPNLTESSIEFGDIDKDRDIDIILSGFDPLSGRRTIIYKNEGLDESGRLTLNEDTDNSLIGVQNGTIDLIDFDNDGDLDMIISGDSKTGDVLEIYQNQNGQFISISATLGGLEAMKNGRTSWGDFNGDGYADILYSGDVLGKGEFTGLAIYDPVNLTFVQDDFDLSQFANSAVAFGDYDNDDDLDMILTGTNKYFDEYDPGSERYISKLFVNVRNESAAVINQPAVRINEQVPLGSTPLAISSGINTPPSVPVLKQADILQDTTLSGQRFVELSWESSTDDYTLSAGLTYALRIGTSSKGNEIFDAQANLDGTRKVSGKGNVEHNTSWKISLSPGSYFWSVQALDASYAASPFSEEKTFTINEEGNVEINVAPVAVDAIFKMRDIETVGYHVGTVSVTDANDDPITFSILSGNDDRIFSIGQTTGIIVIFDDSNLDANSNNEYNLSVLATDGVLSDTAQVTITIEVNFSPIIEDQVFVIDETINVGSVIGNIEASDSNLDELLFELISGNESGAFELSNQGILTVVDPSIFGTTDSIELIISVSDGFEFDQASVLIIINQNNAPVAQGISFDIDSEIAAGTEIGQISATDPDGDKLTFRIVSGNEQGIFSIVDSTGVLSISLPDLLQAATYSLEVEISDGFKTTRVTVLVKVSSLLGDIKNQPVFTIFPNPAHDILSINLNYRAEGQINIVDLSGKSIYNQTTKPGISTIDITGLSPGVYLIYLETDEHREKIKIVVK